MTQKDFDATSWHKWQMAKVKIFDQEPTLLIVSVDFIKKQVFCRIDRSILKFDLEDIIEIIEP